MSSVKDQEDLEHGYMCQLQSLDEEYINSKNYSELLPSAIEYKLLF